MPPKKDVRSHVSGSLLGSDFNSEDLSRSSLVAAEVSWSDMSHASSRDKKEASASHVEKRTFATHSGTFHADEVTACALLLQCDLIDEDKILRTRDLGALKACEYVCDVGGVLDPKSRRFDHHQVDYTGEKSSAGLVLAYLIDNSYIDEGFGRSLETDLIRGVDAHDTGRVLAESGVLTFSHVIAQMVPLSYDATHQELNDAFMSAVQWTRDLLHRMHARYLFRLDCCLLVQQAMERALQEDGRLLIFDKALPWIENFFALGGERHPAHFVLMPSPSGWKLRGIPPTLNDRMQVRTLLPKQWAGLLDQELERVCGIEGALFCHKGRFISVWKSREAALEAYKYCLKSIE